MQNNKNALYIPLVTLLITFGYAVIRYNVFKNVPLGDIPLFIFNKSISFTAVILIGSSFFLGSLAHFWPSQFVRQLYLRKHFGLIGFSMAALHGLISLLLFSPTYYPNFFEAGGKLNLIGEFSMLFGAVAILIFSAVAITSIPSVEKSMAPVQWLFAQRLGYIAFILVLLHVSVMGWSGWFRFTSWPASLPPITLLSALVIILVLIMRVILIGLSREKGS